MKNTSKIILIIALCFLVLGLGLYAAAVGMTGKLGLSFRHMPNTIHSESKTENIREFFQNICIDDVECDIRFVPAEGSATVVEYADCDLYQHDIRVKDGTLIITAEDVSNFWDRFFANSGSSEITIHLPFSQLEELHIDTISGNIQIPADFTAESLSVSSTSGDVELSCPVSGCLTAETVSGNLRLSNTSPESVQLSTTSGNISLEHASYVELFLKTVSGEVILTDITVGEFSDLSSTSGNIQLNDVEAPSLLATTVSGNITGTTPSVKSFETNTTSGNVYLSDHHSDAPVWELTTVSGDIRMTVAP